MFPQAPYFNIFTTSGTLSETAKDSRFKVQFYMEAGTPIEPVPTGEQVTRPLHS